MKIYFCGSITAGREDAALYGRLIEQLQTYGDVLTWHVGASDDALQKCTYTVYRVEGLFVYRSNEKQSICRITVGK